ncbi:Taf3 protein [Triplophysa rosa]|uniref:Taf3 protein n=1 Tax=Triplophysa rosa TaxID=992332 RepID=A0A9W7T6V1_TRIRA|nr:Taf3 protein [Triplophysa rosa]
MCESYARSLLRVSVAQMCQAVGWDAVQLSACDLLSDVLERYVQQLVRSCHRYSELYGRTDPGLSDVDQAFGFLGVSIAELEDYVNNLEPVGFPQTIPQFPISKSSVLQFPAAGFDTDARDALRGERRDYIPKYFPPLVSLQEGVHCCSVLREEAKWVVASGRDFTKQRMFRWKVDLNITTASILNLHSTKY